jgi:hypothetical protein
MIFILWVWIWVIRACEECVKCIMGEELWVE